MLSKIGQFFRSLSGHADMSLETKVGLAQHYGTARAEERRQQNEAWRRSREPNGTPAEIAARTVSQLQRLFGSTGRVKLLAYSAIVGRYGNDWYSCWLAFSVNNYVLCLELRSGHDGIYVPYLREGADANNLVPTDFIETNTIELRARVLNLKKCYFVHHPQDLTRIEPRTFQQALASGIAEYQRTLHVWSSLPPVQGPSRQSLTA